MNGLLRAELGKVHRFGYNLCRFDGSHDFAVWLAYVLTIYLRKEIEGPVPGFLFRGPPGMDKMRVAITGAAIGAPEEGPPAVLRWPNDEEPQRHVLSNLLTQGTRVAVFEDLPDGSALESPTLSHWLRRARSFVPGPTIVAFAGSDIAVADDGLPGAHVLTCDVGTDRNRHSITAMDAHLAVQHLVDAWKENGSKPCDWRLPPFSLFPEWEALVRGIVWWVEGRDPVYVWP